MFKIYAFIFSFILLNQYSLADNRKIQRSIEINPLEFMNFYIHNYDKSEKNFGQYSHIIFSGKVDSKSTNARDNKLMIYYGIDPYFLVQISSRYKDFWENLNMDGNVSLTCPFEHIETYLINQKAISADFCFP